MTRFSNLSTSLGALFQLIARAHLELLTAIAEDQRNVDQTILLKLAHLTALLKCR